MFWWLVESIRECGRIVWTDVGWCWRCWSDGSDRQALVSFGLLWFNFTLARWHLLPLCAWFFCWRFMVRWLGVCSAFCARCFAPAFVFRSRLAYFVCHTLFILQRPATAVIFACALRMVLFTLPAAALVRFSDIPVYVYALPATTARHGAFMRAPSFAAARTRACRCWLRWLPLLCVYAATGHSFLRTVVWRARRLLLRCAIGVQFVRTSRSLRAWPTWLARSARSAARTFCRCRMAAGAVRAWRFYLPLLRFALLFCDTARFWTRTRAATYRRAGVHFAVCCLRRPSYAALAPTSRAPPCAGARALLVSLAGAAPYVYSAFSSRRACRAFVSLLYCALSLYYQCAAADMALWRAQPLDNNTDAAGSACLLLVWFVRLRDVRMWHSALRAFCGGLRGSLPLDVPFAFCASRCAYRLVSPFYAGWGRCCAAALYDLPAWLSTTLLACARLLYACAAAPV